jgi:hypothetical protein
MCTVPSGVSEQESNEFPVWDFLAEETGDLTEEATLAVGPEGVGVKVGGEITMEWEWSDLTVTNVEVRLHSVSILS